MIGGFDYGTWDYDGANYTAPECKSCPDRAYVYESGCKRCEARRWARSPKRIVQHAIEQMSKEMQDLIAEERAKE